MSSNNGKDEDINNMLEKMIIIIDPIMNPDGRARFTKSLEQYRTSPNYDDQLYYILAIGHTEEQTIIIWLNRDWFYPTQPETIGRVPLINSWYPQILVEHMKWVLKIHLLVQPRAGK